MEEVHFVAGAAVAVVDLLLGWEWGVGGGEGMGQGEEDDVGC